jgi:hypothetical protein
MFGVFKILILMILPALFILPWLLVKIFYKNTSIWDVLTGQPMLISALLLPGFILIIMYLVKLIKEERLSKYRSRW